jgi:hypothetical protein
MLINIFFVLSKCTIVYYDHFYFIFTDYNIQNVQNQVESTELISKIYTIIYY